MSSEHQPPAPHLDLDLAADLDAELLEPADSEGWISHVRTCERCAALLSSIQGVREGLAALPAVEPMPEALRTRWTAALAEDPGIAPGRVSDATARAPRRRRLPRANRSLLQLAAVAAACLAVFGITRVLPDMSSGGGSSASGGSAARSAASAGAAAGSSAGTGAGPETDSAASPATKAAAPVSSAASGAGSRGSAPSPAGGPQRVLATTPTGLARQATSLLATRQYSAPAAALSAGCRAGLGGATPELVAPGTFRGRAALLVVQPLGSARLRLTVVRRPCGSEQAREPLLVTDTARSAG